ncbi:efflux RND transporter periplasmic adaptor subunit [Comamonas flocculans]|uniref:Efflux RND transporter periplasmic adaptor subunit n=1 Tax=Comamonas flocculans TaxID=2597701 RepID=A0A5B8RPW1_9BURK|nr:efflux RND transporter periplasmic adaptor subunit [Comamonas flocculans]QEA11660.1 efflux RND transporter periplasmic adaptor subunit [Comamonas flocculans]
MAEPAQTPPSATPAPRPHRKGLSLLLTLLAIALLVGGAWWLVQRGNAPAPGAPGAGPPGRGGPFGGGGGPGVTVGAAVARQGTLPVVVDALGTVTPPVTSTLVPQVSGILSEVLFTEGQMVKKGQVLARIDVRPYEQALAQARGQKARDEAQLTAARLTLSRYQTLLAQDSIARQDVDTQAALVKQLEGAVQADEASVRAAALNVDFATLRAPISGRIGLRAVDPGNLVSSGSATGIAVITQVTPIDVVFSVPQERVGAVLAAQKVGELPVAALDSARTQPLAEGVFLTLDNQVNTATGTVRAKARFANADGALFPGQFVNARLRLGQETGVLVPVTAVRTGPQGDYVYVVDADDTARTRVVKRGLADAAQVLLTQGLQAGERVVTEGGDRVKDGGKVRLNDEQKAAQTQTGQARAATENESPDLSRLPPELREKLEKMTPEERRAFFAQRRGQQGAAR